MLFSKMNNEVIETQINEAVMIEIERLNDNEIKELLENPQYSKYETTYGKYLKRKYIDSGLIDRNIYVGDIGIEEKIFLKLLESLRKEEVK